MHPSSLHELPLGPGGITPDCMSQICIVLLLLHGLVEIWLPIAVAVTHPPPDMICPSGGAAR